MPEKSKQNRPEEIPEAASNQLPTAESSNGLVTASLAVPNTDRQSRITAAERFFGFLGLPSRAGGLWLSTLDRSTGEWQTYGPFRLGVRDLTGASEEEGYYALSEAAVLLSDQGLDVFACPYPQSMTGRRKGAARERLIVHADIDGPMNLNKVRELGGFAVATGSVTDGGPHGHVYVPLTRSVTEEEHTALCKGLGRHVGGRYADSSKVSDNDVLRVPGTWNFKSDPPRLAWIVEGGDR